MTQPIYSRCRRSVVVIALLLAGGCSRDRSNTDGGNGNGGDGGTNADGAACKSDEIVCGGVCVQSASCAFAVTGVTPAQGWQNGGDYLTLEGAGFAKGMKVYIGDGRAAVAVSDAAHARLQTPPGPLGSQDIKITVGGMSATLRAAFVYRSGGLETQWSQKPMMQVRGENPGVAVMQDGRVLVAGGTTTPDEPSTALKTGEIYTRSSDTVAAAANSMKTARFQNSATTLLNGKVLLVGACWGAYNTSMPCSEDPTSAELFDLNTNQFSSTASPLHVGRSVTRTVLLVDGRVLVTSDNDPSVELYDPDSDSFTLVPHTLVHESGFLVRLRDGRALLGGGDHGEKRVEAFDPDTATFSMVGALNVARAEVTAHTLPDGRVLVIAGTDQDAGQILHPLDSMELFDPAQNAFSLSPYKLNVPRAWHASALVRDGTVLVLGGYTVTNKCDSLTDAVDQVDPVKGTVTVFAKLPNKNTEWNAVTLLDGSILSVGGGACGTSMALPDIDFLAGTPIN